MATSGTWVSTPRSTRNGEFDKAPGWLAGSKGASAGIAMRAEPRLRNAQLRPGIRSAPHQLGRPWEGLQGWPEDLCARGLLR